MSHAGTRKEEELLSLSGMTSIVSFAKLISGTLLNTLLSNCQQSSQLPIHVIYRPLSTSKSKFIEEFTCFMEAAALSPHENIILGDVNIQLDSQNCWTDNFNTVLSDFDFVQHVSMPTHIQGHILDVLCTSKSLTSSVHHYVKDCISDTLAVFFTTPFPVINSCRVKCLKIRKLSKIKKTEFMSDFANSELIQAPYKTACFT